MVSLVKIESQLVQAGSNKIPPVEKWNPPLSGDIDICIKSNGDWYHEGQKFTRHALVKLFSSILKKEGEEYFLVTPVEKWRVRVEDRPLLVVDYHIDDGQGDSLCQKIQFLTATEDKFYLDQLHPLRVQAAPKTAERKPYVLVRGNLDALIHRNIFYKLSDHAVEKNGVYGIWSCGIFFRME